MLSVVFIYLAGIGQLCLNWLEALNLSVFILVTLTGLLLLSAIALVVQWLYRLQQARVQLQKVNEELKQKIDRQQQVEAALRANERRFSSLIKNIPGYFYLVGNDPDYTPEFISESVYEVTGYKQEEYLIERTISWRREIHPEERDSVWELVQQAIEARETYESTYRIITKSGEQKWVWERGRGIFDARGELLSLGGFVTDITKRKQTEEELQKVRSQLELFFSQSLDGFFFMMLDEPVQWDDTVDKEKTLDYVFAHQRVTKVNQAILEQYGATEEQFLGLTPNDFYAHQLTYGREIWRRFFDRGKLQLETHECKLDGTPIWIEGDYICFYDAQGRITGHFGIQRDITQRKAAEQALQDSEESLSLALKAAKAGMWQWTKNQNRAIWSEQTFKLLGYEPNSCQANYKNWLKVIHPKDRDRVSSCIKQTFQQKTNLNLEYRVLLSDSTVRWLRGIGKITYNEWGNHIGIAGIQIDITKHKQAEEALKQLNNELEFRVQQRTADLAQANQQLQEEIAERIRTEVALQQQKEILQTIFDNVPIMLAFYDATGRIKMANSALEKILGWSIQDLQEIDLIAECYPNQAYRQQVLDWMLKPTSGWLDLKTRIRNGQFLYTSWANVKLSDGTSIGIGQDITFRKQTEESLKRKTAEMQAMFRAFPDLFFRVNSEGIILDYQAPHLSALYASPQSFIGKSLLEVLPPTVGQKCRKAIAKVLQTQSLVSIEYSLPMASGEEYYEARLVPLETDQIIAIVRQISDRILAEKALRESEEKFRQIAENIREIFYLSDLKQSKILYVNPAYETIWGRTCQSLYEEPCSFLEAVHPEDRSFVIESLERQKKGESTRCEYRIIRPDGSVRWVWDRCFPIRDEKGELYRWCGVVEDITERREAEEKLQHDALHDKLTGLPNRTLLIDRLQRLIKRNQRHKEDRFAVLFLDLDRFKVINDSWGHLVGDQLLIALARRLEQCQRASDTIARIGGDEFVILLEDISSVDDAIQVAERIQHELMLPFILNDHEVFVSASIGITLSSEHYSQPASLLRDADSAMYCAKVRGKARHEVFNPSMHARVLKQLTWENKLRLALNSRELTVYYQPIVSLETNLLQGFEALVRWEHPEQGIVCPNDFIPLAEETGLIIPLDRLVLQQACHQLRHWKEQFCTNIPLTISVNLSGKQFARTDLIEQIDRILAETGLEGQYLKLEITESVLIENAESTTDILRQLQQRKIRVCLDDFGTGYSSLSYLHRFPINSIKIDRSFVSQGKNNDSNDVIVRAIVTIAHELGIEVIAEGIEKVEQLAFLRSLGCHYGQGYWFSPPRDSMAMEVWLKAVGQG
jgi:diguanylate cyclase (GGDEF)-like protein/PAS domain S-box-containing protein